MAITKVPKRLGVNTVVRKSAQERCEAGRLAMLQQKALAERKDSVDDDGIDPSLEDEQGYMKEKSGAKTDIEEVNEVTKGGGETILEQEPEDTNKERENGGASSGSVGSVPDPEVTDHEVTDSAFPTNVRPPMCQSKIVADAIKGVLTIVSAGKCGHRVMIVEKLISYTNSTSKLRIGLADKGIVISGVSPTDTDQEGLFTLRKQGNAYIIYSAPLVKELSKIYLLDFSGTVSKTFSDATYGKYDGRNAVYIKLTKE
jgi:hypothetical protein